MCPLPLAPVHGICCVHVPHFSRVSSERNRPLSSFLDSRSSSSITPGRRRATTTSGRQQEHLVLARRRGADGLDHVADEAGPRLGDGLVLRERQVGQQGGVPHDARLGVAVDIGPPLPARRVRVARPDVLGLQALEFLLRAELVGLGRKKGDEVSLGGRKGRKRLGARNGHTIVVRLGTARRKVVGEEG